MKSKAIVKRVILRESDRKTLDDLNIEIGAYSEADVMVFYKSDDSVCFSNDEPIEMYYSKSGDTYLANGLSNDECVIAVRILTQYSNR
jgi:hypothetical protein